MSADNYLLIRAFDDHHYVVTLEYSSADEHIESPKDAYERIGNGQIENKGHCTWGSIRFRSTWGSWCEGVFDSRESAQAFVKMAYRESGNMGIPFEYGALWLGPYENAMDVDKQSSHKAKLYGPYLQLPDLRTAELRYKRQQQQKEKDNA